MFDLFRIPDHLLPSLSVFCLSPESREEKDAVCTTMDGSLNVTIDEAFKKVTHNYKDRTSICIHPYRQSSMGFWRVDRDSLDYAVPSLGMQITVIYLLTQFFRLFFDPLGLPPIFSQILGGIVLGDTFLGHLLTVFIKKITRSPVGRVLFMGPVAERDSLATDSYDYLQKLFPLRGSGPLGNIAHIGFMLFEFLLGVKMEPKMIYNSGIKAAVVGISGLVFPLMMGIAIIPILKYCFGVAADFNATNSHLEHQYYYIATAQSMTAFPVIATLLTELKILNSEVGRLALSSSMVAEAFNMLGTMIMIHFKRGDAKTIEQLSIGNKLSLSNTPLTKASRRFAHSSYRFCQTNAWFCAPLASTIYLVGIGALVPPAIKWVIRQTKQGTQVKEVYRIGILLAVILSGFISVCIGQNVLFGPFLLGLAIPAGPPLGTTLVSNFETLAVDMLVPLFITISGLRTMISSLTEDHNYLNIIVLLALNLFIMILKVAGTVLPCMYFNMPFRESLALGFIMSAKGIVELSTYNIWRESEVLNNEIFTTMIILVMINAAIIPFLVRALYDHARQYKGHDKRSIHHLSPGSEFKVLTCINEDENVPTFIKLLRAIYPTTHSPVSVYMLHTIELVGRSAPVFISHKDDGKSAHLSDSSKSEHIIKVFRNFEQHNQGMVRFQAFTSISPYDTMHNDVCMLAVNNCTALVILPFHKQWIDGIMDVVGNPSLRALNKNVLECAPCSVGILVDRAKNNRTTSMRIGVPFLGGADDREALALAKRMSENPNVTITVTQLVAAEGKGVNLWDTMLDKEALRLFKLSAKSNERILYKEKVVRDGGQTAWAIHSMEKEYDLLIVGRRHESQSSVLEGLTEWSECPELGEIGDMLASADIKSQISVLVIQQMTI